jgi:hypothetical protein
MLCTHALQAYEKHGLYGPISGLEGRQRGLLVDYDSLPGIVANTLLPMFGVKPSSKWVNKMTLETSFYSKGHGREIKFSGDSADKEQRATESIQKFSHDILDPTYSKLTASFIDGIQRLNPELLDTVAINADGSRRWSALKSFVSMQTDVIQKPQVTVHSQHELPESSSNVSILKNQHSVFAPVDFAAWLPFSNTHESKSFEVIIKLDI